MSEPTTIAEFNSMTAEQQDQWAREIYRRGINIMRDGIEDNAPTPDSESATLHEPSATLHEAVCNVAQSPEFKVRAIAGPLTAAEYRSMTEPCAIWEGPHNHERHLFFREYQRGLKLLGVKIEPPKIADEKSPPDISAITRDISRGDQREDKTHG